jgi:hypothetical protein
VSAGRDSSAICARLTPAMVLVAIVFLWVGG